MRANRVEAAIARYRKAGTKKDAHNQNCTQMGSVYLGVLLYFNNDTKFVDIISIIFQYYENSSKTRAAPIIISTHLKSN